MYAPMVATRSRFTDRAAYTAHSPHSAAMAQFGQAPVSFTPRAGPPAPDNPPATTEESNTVLYVGIGLGVLLVGGVAIYFATRKKGRR